MLKGGKMFEVGKTYEIAVLETGDNDEGKWCTYETRRHFDCIAVDGTLVKFRTPEITEEAKEIFGDSDFSEEILLNTSSFFFHSAKLVEK
jgi:hypothetical protein